MEKSVRLNKPVHVQRLLCEVANQVRSDLTMATEKRARTLTYVASVLLSAMKDGSLEERITALERLQGGNQHHGFMA